MKTMTKDEISYSLKWFNSEEEKNRRIDFIDDYFFSMSANNSTIQEFLDHKTTIGLKHVAYMMAYLKPITEDMLMNFIQGIVKQLFVLKFKRESDEIEFDQLTDPALYLYCEFFLSEPWQKHMIELGTDKGTVFDTQTVKVPIDAENLYKYLRRFNGTIMKLSDVDELKRQYYKYLIALYNREQKTLNDKIIFIKNIDENTLIKIDRAYSFCIDDEIIKKEFGNYEFHHCVSIADFSMIYPEMVLLKTKFKYILNRLKNIIDSPDWFKRATMSINTKPEKCSGLNVPSDWIKTIPF